ncbi:MAG: hypothetical protein WAM60_03555, partial [Candidatus Promineifilaceae bacterium]
MAKRKSFKFPFNRRKITRQLRNVGRFLWRGVRFIWRQTLIYNVVLLAVAILLFSILLSQAFKTYFNCDYLIHKSLDVPSFFCEGKDFTVVKIPGLNAVMNGPLEFIRRGIIWVVLALFIAISGYLTFIINNLKKVIKLLTLDKREWQGLLSVLRIFVT